MSDFEIFKEIPNLQQLCTNVCKNDSIVNGSALSCNLCFDLSYYLSLVRRDVIVSHETRYNTLSELYGDKFPPNIKYKDIDAYNKMYWNHK